MAMMRNQPQGLLRVDQNHPLALGLRSAVLPGVNRAFDASTLRAVTPTGMKPATMPGALAAGFGSTLGAGSTDKVVTGLSGAFPAGRSYYFRARRNGAGGGGLGRLFDKTNGSTGQMIYWSNGSSALVHSFYGGGTEQVHAIAGTSTSAAVGADFELLLTHSQSGSNTVINAYVNGVLVSGNTYAITFNDAASTALTIGNRASDNARGWDGLIECAYVWDRVLSADEAAALRTNRYQMFAAPSEEYDLLTVDTGSTETILTPAGTALSLTGYAPVIVQPQTLAPAGASIVLTGFAPAIIQPQTIAPAGASLALAGYAPQVVQAAPQIIAPGGVSLAFTGYAPSVSQVVPVSLSPSGALLSLTGYAPDVAQGAVSQGSAGGGAGGGGGSVREVRAFADLLDRKPSRSQKKARRKQLESEALALLPDLPEAEKIAPLAARIVYEQEARVLAPLYANRPVQALEPVVVPFDAHEALRQLIDKLLAEALEQQKVAEDEENDVELLLFGT